jgi:hypothetical protein
MDPLDDVLIQQPKLGFGEASFPEIMKNVRELDGDIRWVFYMDGDELAETSLLETMQLAVDHPEAELSKGVRLIKRSNMILNDGTVLPGLSEINLRIWQLDCERPPKPHSWIEGINGDPFFWPVGAVRETRNLREYIHDQVSYIDADPLAEATTRDLFKQTFAQLVSFLGYDGAMQEFFSAGNVRALDILKDLDL